MIDSVKAQEAEAEREEARRRAAFEAGGEGRTG
jgi:hypothetical protein